MDHSTGRSFEHRRNWIEDRIRLLASIFSIDVSAYAVMSNHCHIVLKLSPEESLGWSDKEVLTRWTSLFKGPTLVQKYIDNQNLSPVELNAVSDCVDVYRKRLADLGWYMKCLNEPIARQANKEDECTGHFWESRYKSQALLTQEALLSAMCYVDLNPVRAGMAITPEQSDYTSIQERIRPKFNTEKSVGEQIELGALSAFDLTIKPLQPFEEAITNSPQNGLPFNFPDYLELVDFTGRAVLANKRGAIDKHLPPILLRLNISTESWLKNSTQFEAKYRSSFAKGPPSIRRSA
ncbi:transposase [Halioxenophilus aromaticivorans]|uniref:transposase n=1 Tax=Halioxenophilus aromaticivorans TaxID=1306992 RepID=UPI0031EB8EAE